MDVVLTPAAADEFDALPRTIKSRVLKILERLRNWPNVSGAKPLKGHLTGKYRMRTGDYRVQFQPDRTRVVVEKIDHRDGFYGD